MAYLSDIFKGNESGLHVGTLATFLKGKVPAGYLIPNGAEFSSLEYPELFTYLGSNKLPDLIDDESVPVGSIMPWMSDSDIPDGWHHLGAQGGTDEISSGQRKYDPEQYPEFCKFLQTVRGDNYLRVMRFGEVLRQVVKETPQGELNSPDVTDAWGWQNDAIRPVTGSIVAFSGIGGIAEPLYPDGVFRRKSTGTNKLLTTASTGTENTNYGLAFDISNVHPVAKDVRMVNRSVNYLIKVKPSKITKTTIAIKAAGRVSDEGLMQVEGIRKELDTFSHANLFINGSMEADQRNDTTAVSGRTFMFFADRWIVSMPAPEGQTRNHLKGYINRLNRYLTDRKVASAIGQIIRYNAFDIQEKDVPYEYCVIYQKLEPTFLPVILNKPVTFSATVRAQKWDDENSAFFSADEMKSLLNEFFVKVRTKSSTKTNVTNDFTVKPNKADPRYLEITATIQNISDNNEDGKEVVFVDVGIALSTDPEWMNKWAAFNITNVKFESSSKATPFVPDDPATNLAKCQRYYFKCFNYYSPRSYNVGGSFRHILTVNLPVSMRAAPAVSYKCALGSDSGDVDSNYQPAVSRYTEHAHFMATLTSGQYLRLDEAVFDAEL